MKILGLAFAIVIASASLAVAQVEDETAPCMWKSQPVETEKVRQALIAGDNKAAMKHIVVAAVGCFKKKGAISIDFDELLKNLEETKPSPPVEE